MITDVADLYKLPMPLVKRIALETAVDADLIAAIVVKESGGRAHAVQYQPKYKYVHNVTEYARLAGCTPITEQIFQKTSFGLMQIMGATARYTGFRGNFGELFDPETNLRYGARYLRSLIVRYGSTNDAISAYNQGQPFKGADGKYLNQKYVDNVLATKRRLKADH